MSEVSIRLPRTIKRIQILRDEDYQFQSYDILPKFERAVFEDFHLSDDLQGSSLLDYTSQEQTKITFTEEKSIIYPTTPTQISLRKVQSEYMSLAQVEDEIQKAYERGFEEAREKTQKTYEIELQKRNLWISNFDSLAEDLRSQFTREISQLEDAVIPIAKMLASRILEREVSDNSDIIIEQTRKVIKSLDNETIFKIRVHPYNFEIMNKVRDSLFTDKSRAENVIITSDDSINQGSCIFETNAGNIDASFRAQLDKLEMTLRSAMPNTTTELGYFSIPSKSPENSNAPALEGETDDIGDVYLSSEMNEPDNEDV